MHPLPDSVVPDRTKLAGCALRCHARPGCTKAEGSRWLNDFINHILQHGLVFCRITYTQLSLTAGYSLDHWDIPGAGVSSDCTEIRYSCIETPNATTAYFNHDLQRLRQTVRICNNAYKLQASFENRTSYLRFQGKDGKLRCVVRPIYSTDSTRRHHLVFRDHISDYKSRHLPWLFLGREPRIVVHGCHVELVRPSVPVS